MRDICEEILRVRAFTCVNIHFHQWNTYMVTSYILMVSVYKSLLKLDMK